ncbi:MAG: sigma-70 family RNA polymerase sigma factor [Isosphaeraceae bacterium]
MGSPREDPAERLAGDEFERHRRRLMGLAYRMLGSVAESEDIVQDAYLRWHKADRSGIADARAFLSKVVARLCLDHLKSARVRRESYVGPWLPEPVLDNRALTVDGAGELADDLSVGLMLTLERLSPLERAAFLLHDVFDLDHTEVARVLGRSEAACRQLAARGRAHVKESRPRFPATDEGAVQLAAAFLKASRTGDVETLGRLLAEEAVLHSDGGGKRTAALRPILGRDRITRFFAGLAQKAGAVGPLSYDTATINGQPGYVVTEPDGSLTTVALEILDGRILAVYIMRNPEKLGHLMGPRRDPAESMRDDREGADSPE